jgi:hypothetical protein
MGVSIEFVCAYALIRVVYRCGFRLRIGQTPVRLEVSVLGFVFDLKTINDNALR